MDIIKSNKNRIIPLILLVLLVACFSVFKLRTAKEEHIIVRTVKVENVPSNSNPIFSGKLEAFETCSIVSKTTGKVGHIYADIGSTVNAGDVLLTLEASDLAASVAQAQAAVQLAYSNREQALLDYQAQKLNYDRNQILLDQGALSQSDFDNKFALPFKKAEELAIHGVDAQVRQAEANLQLAQANYANSSIISPIHGVVTAKNINIGELATTSQILFSLANLDKVVVMASVEEDEINKVETGEQIPVQVEAASKSNFTGTVTNVAQAASPTTKAFLVKISIDNPDHILKPGMFAKVLWKSEANLELEIPREAVINETGKTYVWILNNGIVSQKEVETEVLDETSVGIKSGLSIGQEIVTSSQGQLKEGLRVDAVNS